MTDNITDTEIYHCSICNYDCDRKTLIEKHYSTKKHLVNIGQGEFFLKDYTCNCGKSYKHRQSLHTHKKKCIIVNANKEWDAPMVNKDFESISQDELHQAVVTASIPSMNFQELVIDLMKKNQELQETIIKQQEDHQQKIVDLIPMMGNNNHITNNINNKINLNVFLNETCKDALNIKDFMKTLHITVDDLELTREKGLIESVNNQIINSLRNMEIEKRPIHCSDQKRKIMHIKDNNEWQRDNNCEKLKTTIDNIAAKQLSNFSVWEKENPEFMHSENGKENYMQLVSNITKDVSTDDKGRQKILSSIAKETSI